MPSFASLNDVFVTIIHLKNTYTFEKYPIVSDELKGRYEWSDRVKGVRL